MLRLAIIGCGNHSRKFHASALARYAQEYPGTIELAAACDRDLEKARAFCRDFGFAQPFADAEQMISSLPLAGCVAVMPIPAIAAMAGLLLERGMPCTIEKPLGASPREVRELAAVAGRTGTPHMVSVDRRFNPLLKQATDWCRQRGPLRYITCSMLRHRRGEASFMVETAVHAVDALRAIGGQVANCTIRRPGAGPSQACWYHLSMDFADGLLCDLRVFPTDGWSDERYELFGENYYATVSSFPIHGASLRCYEQDQLVLEQDIPKADYNFVTCGAYGELQEFVAALQQRRSPRPTVADVLPSLELCWKAGGLE